ncbi:MAG TPA: phosphoribosylformylglycinamidine synthase subunit PurL [bacterium]|nr:phosphoribosylformylglycinamidine synthase subunit PurL [bacterium]
MINADVIGQHGLTPGEYGHILKILGREPTMVELGIFSVMWSEHCSYKSSKIYLKKLPTKGRQVICGPGENAGIVDIGDGLAVIFKMESHNHPSMIEPYQGATTGVGGILRDIFTMGARPIALLNSLRFGNPQHPGMRHVIDGVVGGIAGYGNCMGIPTVGGEVYFDDCYNGNVLVNAMCVGVVRQDRIFYAKAAGVGNPVIYVGSKTGRDGIHGATMASDVFEEGSEQKRPQVQVGDPFTEKLLMEACLELFHGKDCVGIQDMGAAGLTCSSLEMAGKGGVGIDLDLATVPQREQGMTSYEIMLSESQERMLLVGKKGSEKRILKLFDKWDLDAAVVGRVVKGDRVKVLKEGGLEGTIPTGPITDEAPVYKRPVKKPAYLGRVREEFAEIVGANLVFARSDGSETLKKLLGSPTIASKKWVYRQYDHMVGANTIVLPGSDAAVVRIKEPHTEGKLTKKGLAMTSDCNSRYVYLNPRRGAAIAVAEAARNIACSGGRPLAVTDCLNFASPEDPEIMWQFREALNGMGEACRVLGTPIISGNVSFYNQSPDGAVFPTPTIGMIGLLDDVSTHCTQWFKEEGDVIVLLGPSAASERDLGGSEYLKLTTGKICGDAPALNLKKEKAVQDLCLAGIKKGWIRSAHDCSEGGIAVALAECCFTGPGLLGASIAISGDGAVGLFAETQSRILVSIRESDLQSLLKAARLKNVPVKQIGSVTGKHLNIKDLINVPVKELESVWASGFERSVFGECAAS